MILEIPLQPIINQTLTCVINEQTLNITIKGISVNNKPLQNNTPAFEPKDEIIDKTLVLASSIYMMASINLNNTPIIANAYCNNAVYINQFPSNLNGYLFFYKDDWYDGNDKIYYTNFGTNGNRRT